MISNLSRLLLATVVASCLTPLSANAAGFAIHEQSGIAMGTAGAYNAAQGASSIFYNPAGIAALEGSQLEFGLNIIVPATDFTGPTNRPEYETLSMESQVFTPVDIYYTRPLSETTTFGFGMFTYMGLGTQWEEDWVGRTITEEISLETITLNPTMAWNLGKTRFAIGMDVMYGMALLKKDSFTGYPMNGYVDVEIEGHGLGFGWNFGLQHDVSNSLTVGLSYRSGMTLEAEGDAAFTFENVTNPTHLGLLGAAFPATDVRLDLDIPGIFMTGFEWTPENIANGQLTWRSDIVFTQWDVYKNLFIDFETETSALKDSNSLKDYENTWAVRTGVEYAVNDKTTVRAGYYYEQNTVKDELVEPSLPDAERNGFSFGGSYEMSESLAFDAYFLFVALQDRVSTFEEFPGGYESSIPIFGLSVRKSF
jgi:long-chain fatty acid transport protein